MISAVNIQILTGKALKIQKKCIFLQKRLDNINYKMLLY